ncbi:hypothetical protein BO94DRAFT_581194 [Aspergillus sclerotioniger CBS 115572]|uniref:Hemerythrin-like domain-containing protein n=1 Tax=Aspergillus sclerotioniger CBS 115572 TaxID=1450535 RepID=A0A317XD43_9EURO|nr:hypothetical protein BO94DRAFT_581194 [Aspergillus sclerotioniger CBS 115572]PWY96061.1 hypothetical protein BO94DRAFT_581194 [Aspergillus sclerotioniger CBS 115572]
MATNTPLSPADFRTYNHMAEKMGAFHNHFRMQWNVLSTAATTSKRPKGMTLRSYLKLCLEFCHGLDMHHKIEETRVFPFLATRMPAFKKKSRMVTQHKTIHKGLDDLESYAQDCLQGDRDFQWYEVKDILDKFGTTLWEHLDEEVEELGAEKLRQFWSKEEILRMPM